MAAGSSVGLHSIDRHQLGRTRPSRTDRVPPEERPHRRGQGLCTERGGSRAGRRERAGRRTCLSVVASWEPLHQGGQHQIVGGGVP